MDDFPQGDIEKFSKCLSGRRHAIGDNDDKPFSLIDGMFEKPIDGGTNIKYTIIKVAKENFVIISEISNNPIQ
jgi:hypothetical protein